VLMVELAIALYLGERTESWSAGFLWVAAGNFVLFLIALLLKKPMIHSIQNGLSKFIK
jgi:hypothetical protein